MSKKPTVTIKVITENETGGAIKSVKVVVGGEVIDDLTGLAKGANSQPSQYNGPSGDISWKVSFTDHDRHHKAGSVDAEVTKADTSAQVILNADSFTVKKPSGDVTQNYS